MRTLLLEDSENDRYMLKRFLEPYCASFAECGTLGCARSLCRTQIFDLIIADLRLEDSDIDATLDGLREIKQMQPQSGLVVCSGMPLPDLKDRSIMAGADVFIAKTPEIYRDSAMALLMAVNAAMLHKEPAGRGGDFMARVRMLRAIAETPH